MELSETQKTLLAMLKNRDPERYRLKSDYNVKTQVVESGPQAVDNRIKALAGDQARKHNYNMDGINI